MSYTMVSVFDMDADVEADVTGVSLHPLGSVSVGVGNSVGSYLSSISMLRFFSGRLSHF